MGATPKRPIDPDRARWYRARAAKAERELAAGEKMMGIAEAVKQLKAIHSLAVQKIRQSGLEADEREDLLRELEELKTNGRSFAMPAKSSKRRSGKGRLNEQ